MFFIASSTVIWPLAALLMAAFTALENCGYQVGVRVIVPPYPFDDPGTFESLSKDAVIYFKRPVYVRMLTELAAFAFPAGAPPLPDWWQSELAATAEA